MFKLTTNSSSNLYFGNDKIYFEEDDTVENSSRLDAFKDLTSLPNIYEKTLENEISQEKIIDIPKNNSHKYLYSSHFLKNRKVKITKKKNNTFKKAKSEKKKPLKPPNAIKRRSTTNPNKDPFWHKNCMKFFTRSFLNFLNTMEKEGFIKEYCEKASLNEEIITNWLKDSQTSLRMNHNLNRHFFLNNLGSTDSTIKPFFHHYCSLFFTEYSISSLAHSKTSRCEVFKELVRLFGKFIASRSNPFLVFTLKKAE